MKRTQSFPTKSLAVGVALATALTLSGCFANPLDQIADKIGSEVAEGGAEKLVEGMTGSDIDMETGELPKDFPSDVPLIDAEIVTAITLGVEGGQSWSVVLKVDDVSAAMESARELLLGAGFEETLWNNVEGMPTGGFSSDAYGIIIGGIDDGAESSLSYQVITTAAE